MTLPLRRKMHFKNIYYLVSGQAFLLHRLVDFMILLISKELLILIHHMSGKNPSGKRDWNWSICLPSP